MVTFMKFVVFAFLFLAHDTSSAPVHSSLFNRNLVINPGAEEELKIGWTHHKNGMPTRRTGADYDIQGKNGKYLFAGPKGTLFSRASDYASISQTIDIRGASDLVDRGQIMAKLSASLGGHSTQYDEASVSSIFLDAAGETIEEFGSAKVTGDDRGWVSKLLERKIETCAVPKNTRYILINLELHYWGTIFNSNNDGYADDISLVLSTFAQKFALDSNLVGAPGADQDRSECAWTYSGKLRRAVMMSGGEGSNIWMTMVGGKTTAATQWIYVGEAGAAIDAGTRGLQVTALVGGEQWKPDSGAVRVEPYDHMQATSLMPAALTPVAGPVTASERAGKSVLLRRWGHACTLPTGTRWLKVSMEFRNTAGSSGAAIDSIDVRIGANTMVSWGVGKNLVADPSADYLLAECYFPSSSSANLVARETATGINNADGIWMLASGLPGPVTGTQWIDMSAGAAQLDAGLFGFLVRARLGGTDPAPDSRLEVSFSGAKGSIGSVRTLGPITAAERGASPSLVGKEMRVCPPPVGTRFVMARLSLNSATSRGAAADVVDVRAVPLAMQPAVVVGIPLLVGTAAENDFNLCKWPVLTAESSPGAALARKPAGGIPGAGGDAAYGVSVDGTSLVAVQWLNMSSAAANAAIAAGERGVVLTAFMGGRGASDAAATLRVDFMPSPDDSAAPIASAELPAVTAADRGSADELLKRELTVHVPSETVAIRAALVFSGPGASGLVDHPQVKLIEHVTEAPTAAPTEAPSPAPTEAPSPAPTEAPTAAPTEAPSPAPTEAPSPAPTDAPSPAPTDAPSPAPAAASSADAPTDSQTAAPSPAPTDAPSPAPTDAPSPAPTDAPSPAPTDATSPAPTASPTESPGLTPTESPAGALTLAPSPAPTDAPTDVPSGGGSDAAGPGSAAATSSAPSSGAGLPTRRPTRGGAAAAGSPAGNATDPAIKPGFRGAAQAAGGAAAAGTAIAGPAAAAQIGRVVGLMAAMGACGRGAAAGSEPLLWVLSPLQLAIAPAAPGAHFRGAAVGNVVLLIVAVGIAAAVVATLRASRYKGHSSPLREAAAAAFFPSVLVIPAALLTPGAVFGGVGALASGGSRGLDWLAALMAFATLGGVVAWIGRFAATAMAGPLAPMAYREVSHDVTDAVAAMGNGEFRNGSRPSVLARAWRWVWAETGEWVERSTSITAEDAATLRMHALMFRPYRGDPTGTGIARFRLWWLPADILVSGIAAAVAGAAGEGCIAVAGALAALLCAAALATAVVRPHTSRLRNLLNAGSTAAVALAAVLFAAAAAANDADPLRMQDDSTQQAAAGVAVLALLLLLADAAVAIAKAVLAFCQRPAKDAGKRTATFGIHGLDEDLLKHRAGHDEDVDEDGADALLPFAESNSRGSSFGEPTSPMARHTSVPRLTRAAGSIFRADDTAPHLLPRNTSIASSAGAAGAAVASSPLVNMAQAGSGVGRARAPSKDVESSLSSGLTDDDI